MTAQSSFIAARWALAAILLSQLVLSLLLLRGYDGGDDYCYTRLAAERAVEIDPAFDTSPCPHYFKVRHGFLAPMSAAFALGGVSERVALVPLVCLSLLGTVAMYFLANTLLGAVAAPIAALIYAWMPYTLRGSGVFYADFSAFHWSTVGLMFLALARDAPGPSRRCGLMAASATAFAVSWLAKSSVFCLGIPILAVLAGRLWRDRARWQLPVATFVGVAALLAGAEMVSYRLTTGDYLERLTALEGTIADFDYLWDDMVSVQRFLVDGPAALTTHGAYGLVVYLALPVAFFILVGRGAAGSRSIALWFAFLFLYLNFMTTSFQEYKPIRPMPIYFWFIAQPAILLVAGALRDVSRWRRLERRMRVRLLVAATCLVAAAGPLVELRQSKKNSQLLRSAASRLTELRGDGGYPLGVSPVARAWGLGLIMGRPVSPWDAREAPPTETVVVFGETMETLGQAARSLELLYQEPSGGFLILEASR